MPTKHKVVSTERREPCSNEDLRKERNRVVVSAPVTIHLLASRRSSASSVFNKNGLGLENGNGNG